MYAPFLFILSSQIETRRIFGEVGEVIGRIPPISHRGRTGQASLVSGRSGNRGCRRKDILSMEITGIKAGHLAAGKAGS